MTAMRRVMEQHPFLMSIFENDIDPIRLNYDKIRQNFSDQELSDVINTLIDLLESPKLDSLQALNATIFVVMGCKILKVNPVDIFSHLLYVGESLEQVLMLKFLRGVILEPEGFEKMSALNVKQLSNDLTKAPYSPQVLEAIKLRLFDALHASHLKANQDLRPSFAAFSLHASHFVLEALEDEFHSLPVPFPLDDELPWLPMFREATPEEKEGQVPLLMQQACFRPLLFDERKLLQEVLRSDSGANVFFAVLSEDSTSINLSGMLTHNMSLLQDILITLSPVQSPAIVKLANAFLECPATADSIEGVGMIIKSRCTLPQNFAANFVSHCIESSYGLGDLSSQVRLVRWTCLFIQNVLRDDPSSLFHLLSIIQSFCLSFTTVGEALSLFSIVKSLEGH